MNYQEDSLNMLARLKGLWHRLVGDENRVFHDWVLTMLEIRPDDNIIEIGCSSQSAMGRILRVHRKVFVVGVDVSEAAISHSWQTNSRAVRQGRAMLIQTDIVDSLPAFAKPFTRSVAVNAGNFWGRPVATLAAVRKAMTPGGKIAVAVQPREKEATDADALRQGKELRGYLTAAGFTSVRLAEKALSPVAAVCVTGINPFATPATEEESDGRRRK